MHIKIDAWLKYFIYLPVCLTGGSSFIATIPFFINNTYSFIVRNALLGIEQQWQQRQQVNQL